MIGAAGPMGFMHVVRAASSGLPGLSLTAVDIDDARLAHLAAPPGRSRPSRGVELRFLNSRTTQLAPGFSYIAVMVPAPPLVGQAVELAGEGCRINMFAGFAGRDAGGARPRPVIEGRCYLFGTSGSGIPDMKAVLRKLERGELDTNISVDAVTGMEGVAEALAAVEARTAGGKIVVYPSLHDLGMVRLSEMGERFPSVAGGDPGRALDEGGRAGAARVAGRRRRGDEVAPPPRAGDLRLADEARPVPGPGEALVRVTAVGICGSDLHWYDESAIGDAVLTRPLVLGHEAAGVIVSGPRRGQRVAIDPDIPCRRCEQCRAGRGHLCPRGPVPGPRRHRRRAARAGGLARRCLVPVPDGLDDADGAMLEPLGVAIHALRLARIRPGAAVGVFGCGPIGLLLIQLARAAGATTIVATDRLPHRVGPRREAGATVAALVAGGSERGELLAATGGHGVDAAIEIAGEDDAIETAIALAAPAGTVVVAGIPAQDRTSFTASTARRKGLTIKLSRRMNRVYPDVIRLVEAGLVDVRSVVTASYPLSEFKPPSQPLPARG